MSVCENCGNVVRDGTRHDKDQDNYMCKIIDLDSEQVRGWTIRKPTKNLYKR